jgi:hypothetical protein
MSEADTIEGLFDFERDLHPEFKCIPMIVRYKLDLVGLKVSLTAWNRLSLNVRKQLLTDWPTDTPEQRAALREWLINWLRTTSTQPPKEVALDHPAWDDLTHVPEFLAELTASCAPALSQPEWAGLGLLQRVALVKLARSTHEREQVPRALAEFRSRKDAAKASD